MTVTRLFGRTAEQEAIERTISNAAAGQTSVLVLRGEPGAGKTALLREAAMLSAPYQVLQIGGHEFSQRSYAVLAEAMASASGLRLDPTDQAALDAAVGRGGMAMPSHVAAATLALLAELSARDTTILLIDDLQWLDTASVEVLAFVFDRLSADRLGLIATMRSDATNPFEDLVAATTLNVAALDTEEALALLKSRTVGLTDEVAADLVDAIGGNPLALITAAQLLSAPQRAGTMPLPTPIPVGTRLTEAFATTVQVLSASTQHALLLLAATDVGEEGVLRDALETLGLGLDALAPAVEAGLVTDLLAPRFAHPLVRSAAYHGASLATRRSAHRALAAAMEHGDVLRRAEHLIAATGEPNDFVAAVLDQATFEALQRGAPRRAAELSQEAARLSPPGSARDERILQAGKLYWLASDHLNATNAFGLGAEPASSPEYEALARYGRGAAVTFVHGPNRGYDALVQDITKPGQSDDTAAQRLVNAAIVRWLDCDIQLSLEEATKATARAANGAEQTRRGADLIKGIGLSLSGEVSEADAPLARALTWAKAIEPGPGEWTSKPALVPWVQLGYSALMEVVAERPSVADALLQQLVGFAFATNMIGLLWDCGVWYGELKWRFGDVTTGWETLSRILNDPGAAAVSNSAWVRTSIARFEAALGHHSAAEANATAALRFSRATKFHLITAFALHALSVDAVVRRDYDAAEQHSAEIADLFDGGGLHNPSFLWWEADYIEALANVDREAARSRLAGLRQRTEQCRGAIPTAHVHRCAALLADANEAPDLFRRALAVFNRLPDEAPFEHARTHLLFAEAVHSIGDSETARFEATRAASIFTRIGAGAWLARCSAVADVDATKTLTALLTEAELRVALTIGRGASNKQAARELYLSVKTVEYHLSNIYRKLDIRTRAQLARIIAELGAP